MYFKPSFCRWTEYAPDEAVSVPTDDHDAPGSVTG